MTQAAPTGTIAPKRILVVDDEPLVADTIARVLAFSGHTAEIAPDAENALTMFEAGNYDLVITDLSLPKMDGLELARMIKGIRATQPIILITAYADSIRGDRERLARVDFLMGKPFSVEQMQQAIAKIFSAASSSV